MEIISGLPEDATISLYRCGPMVDLCRGPHLPNTGLLKATAVNAFSRAFWRADVKKEGLQVPADDPPDLRGPSVRAPALMCWRAALVRSAGASNHLSLLQPAPHHMLQRLRAGIATA